MRRSWQIGAHGRRESSPTGSGSGVVRSHAESAFTNPGRFTARRHARQTTTNGCFYLHRMRPSQGRTPVALVEGRGRSAAGRFHSLTARSSSPWLEARHEDLNLPARSLCRT